MRLETGQPAPGSAISLDDETEAGADTQYGASASSPAGRSGSDEERDWFVSARGEDTEVDDGHGAIAGLEGQEKRRSFTFADMAPEAMDRASTPTPGPSQPRQSFQSRRPPPSPHHPLPASWTLLPWRLFVRRSRADRKGKCRENDGFSITRRNCEDGLLLLAVGYGVYKLVGAWDERALAGEISLLVGLSIIYKTVRPSTNASRANTQPGTPIPRPHSPASASFQYAHTHVRERSGRSSMNHGNLSHLVNGLREGFTKQPLPPAIDEDRAVLLEPRGCIWGTEEREYRDGVDDGALFALLFGPLIAAAMLHSSLTQLVANPANSLPQDWDVEPPLYLPSTPIRHIDNADLPRTEATLALSALATSRRNLVQLFTLLSFVLLVHLTRSMVHEHKLCKSGQQLPTVPSSVALEREASDPHRVATSVMGLYWLKRGEWRRTGSVVGFAFLVTTCCLGVKICTAIIGRGVWSDMSPSDIVIATLFYQFSLYVCVRLARKGFTLGELGVVCNAATALFMETVNLTRMKIALIATPYIKTYRLPTPLLTFQLALIPGSLLAGFLLSPLLVLSRTLAQKPAHRLRFPHEKPVHRRLLALGFYGGAALVCGGIVGVWAKWCLGWRDPWVWVIMFLVDGKRPWSRPALISYWGALAMISVAGWSRQLIRARRHRRYVVGVRETNGSSAANGTASATDASLSGVASQMMDAADQRLPTLSVNARRKFFHALAVVMFIPGITLDPAFTHLSFSVAFAAFNFAEYVRYFALWPFGVSVHLFLNEFLDSKDSGTAILSHFYLLAGCASPLWLEGRSEILSAFGVISLGIGDALASIVGRRLGHVRWSTSSGKTVEGSVAFFASVLFSSIVFWAFGLIATFNMVPFAVTTALVTLLEAFSAQNDNLILPIYGWAVGTLLGV